MRRRDIIIMSTILFASSLLAVQVTYGAMLQRSLFHMPSFHKTVEYNAQANCGTGKQFKDLAAAATPELRKLAVYQTFCGTSPTEQLMLFTDMPNSDPNAVQKATAIAKTLQEFQKTGVKPLVVFEPTTDWGAIDFVEFRNGFYDQWIDTYFKTLKAAHLSDAAMGTWLPFPEANLPYWNHQNSKPEDFAINVTKVITTQKKYFPHSKATIMLNSATYANDDFDWASGEYVSLLPYVRDIPKGLVESFGLQGLPWMPAANQNGAGVLDSSEYLNTRLAQEAADALQVKKIWFNTGTFGRKYTLDPEKTVTMTPEQRKDILSSVVEQAKKLKAQGYDMSINLFAQDKSGTEEATDWSYWSDNQPKTSPASVVFNDFVSDAHKAGIEVWLFDR